MSIITNKNAIISRICFDWLYVCIKHVGAVAQLVRALVLWAERCIGVAQLVIVLVVSSSLARTNFYIWFLISFIHVRSIQMKNRHFLLVKAHTHLKKMVYIFFYFCYPHLGKQKAVLNRKTKNKNKKKTIKSLSPPKVYPNSTNDKIYGGIPQFITT